MSGSFSRILSNRAGLWLAVTAVLLVVARHAWVVAQKPAHILEIADELGSLNQIIDDVYPNPANTRLVFSQMTDDGVGIYFCDMTSGKRKLVCEQKAAVWSDWSSQHFKMVGWSPDGKLFACAFPPHDSQQPEEEILICDGQTGDVVTKLGVDSKFVEFTWLMPASFAYTYWSDDRHNIAVITQKSEKEWAQTQIFRGIGTLDKELAGLTALSAESVAWREGGSLWTLDFATGEPRKVWDSTTNQLMEFTCSREDQQLLLNCIDEKGQSLIRLDPRTQSATDLGRVSDQTNAVHNAIWTGQNTRYTYVGLDHGAGVFYVKSNVAVEPLRVPWPGLVVSYCLNGDHLYVLGDEPGEAPGIWDCNIRLGQSRLVMSDLEQPLKHVKITGATPQVFTNSTGSQGRYFVSEPISIVTGRKYPLIIGQDPHLWWEPLTQVAANGGCYCVLIDRPSWWENLDNFKDDVLRVYEIMAKNPNVDIKHVYLYGTSAETPHVCELLAEKPDLWNGAILFSPVATPDVSRVRISKLLLVGGTSDGDIVKELTDYQDNAAQAGFSVTLDFLKDAAHVAKTKRAVSERLETLASFLSQ
jgi:hypothetical protein